MEKAQRRPAHTLPFVHGGRCEDSRETRTDGRQDLHGPHGGLDVEPELLQREQALTLQVLQLSDQDQSCINNEGAVLSPQHRLSCDVSPVNSDQDEQQILHQSLFLSGHGHRT
ncbi:hypothetical protein INR49_003229 [Caranx melampygus]|nr:hypothetical protein INR49_003229 [Caranx melampygus]